MYVYLFYSFTKIISCKSFSSKAKFCSEKGLKVCWKSYKSGEKLVYKETLAPFWTFGNRGGKGSGRQISFHLFCGCRTRGGIRNALYTSLGEGLGAMSSNRLFGAFSCTSGPIDASAWSVVLSSLSSTFKVTAGFLEVTAWFIIVGLIRIELEVFFE